MRFITHQDSLPIKVWTIEISMRAWLFILRKRVFFREEKLQRPKLKKRNKTKSIAAAI